MRTTLLIKQTDMWLQVLALAIPALLGLILQNTFTALCAYYSVGAVQAISALLHRFQYDRFFWARGRKAYNIMLAVVFIIAAVLALSLLFNNSVFWYAILPFLYIMLLLGPIMAVWYFIVTLREVVHMQSLVNRKQFV